MDRRPDNLDTNSEQLRRALDHNAELGRQNQEFRKVIGILTVKHSEARMREDYFASLAEKALVNPKTDLPNEEATKLAFEKLKKYCSETASSAMYFDLNHFKEVNDNHGHDVGDELLRAVGGNLAHRLRDDDYLGHLHGDEFLVLLPFTPVKQAEGVAQELNDIIQQTTIDVNGSSVSVSASFGVCAINPALGFEEIRNQADQAMYAAKRSDSSNVSIG